MPIINNELLDDLKYLIYGTSEGFVFTKSNGKPLTVRMINYITDKAGEQAGISNPNPRLKHINPHIFRRSIVRHLKNKGFSAEWIQNFLGHAPYKITIDMYGTLSFDEMQREVEKRLLE